MNNPNLKIESIKYFNRRLSYSEIADFCAIISENKGEWIMKQHDNGPEKNWCDLCGEFKRIAGRIDKSKLCDVCLNTMEQAMGQAVVKQYMEKKADGEK